MSIRTVAYADFNYRGQMIENRGEAKMSEIVKKASDIIQARSANGGFDNQYCTIIQEDLDGKLTASVITASKADGIKSVTFGTGLGNNKVKRIKRDKRGCINFCTDSYNISLIGNLEIITDEAVKKDNWYKGLEEHFKGPEDPDFCILKFTTERYRLMIDWEEAEGEV